MTSHVLILCTHNSARSVLAEGMLNHWAGKLGRDVLAHSAGSAPSGRVRPGSKCSGPPPRFQIARSRPCW